MAEALAALINRWPMAASLAVSLTLGAQCPGGAVKSPPKTQQERQEDAILVELVVQREVAENHLAKLNRVCLLVDGRGPDRLTIRCLKSHKLALYSCPTGWWPWKSIEVTLGARLDANTIEVKVQTADQDNSDIGLILREGTYTLHRNPLGEWEIAGYTKTCCGSDSHREPVSSSDSGEKERCGQ
jgi:hypothetical protein